jgi:hypothetical protein
VALSVLETWFLGLPVSGQVITPNETVNVSFLIITEPFKKVSPCMYLKGARRSVVGWGTMLQAGRWRVWFPVRSLDFLIDLNLPATLWPWVDSASNRN